MGLKGWRREKKSIGLMWPRNCNHPQMFTGVCHVVRMFPFVTLYSLELHSLSLNTSMQSQMDISFFINALQHK